MNLQYPFAAVTGQDTAKKALLCTLVSDDIRSVLVMGNRGTAKSTLVRSLKSLVENREMLTIPQNITYDRLLGMIDLETAVSRGKVQIQPGLLKQADGKFLFADDINLMDEGIVKNLLNTLETGYFFLEREGFSQLITTRFTLLATMDPAEGELSPSLMDHFDLCVVVDSIEDHEMRADIITRHLWFEQNGPEFIQAFDDETTALKQTIFGARDRLAYVSIPQGHAELISSLCLELAVRGQRGDIATAKAAKAIAALDNRDDVVFDDIKLACLLALEHRRSDRNNQPSRPPASPPEDENETDTESENDDRKNDSQSSRNQTPPDSPPDLPDENPDPGQDNQRPFFPPPLADQIFSIGSTFEVIRYLDERSRLATRKQKSGRRTRVTSLDTSGHYHSFRHLTKNRNDIAVDATLRAAAPFQKSREKKGLAISVKKTDLREKVREKKIANTILFLVDASGSMGVHKRMVAVKGAILSLLTDAYQKRDRIGLMTFRGKDSQLLLPPTRSPDLAARMLHTIPTGGMTPLVTGIAEAYGLLMRGKYATPDENKSIVILTDGRVNVAMKNGAPYQELTELARELSESRMRFVVVDTETGFPRLGRALMLASDLNASYFQLEDLNSRHLAGSVQNFVYSRE